MAQPTAQDQLALELINRARANPQAEADRYPELGGDINEGLPSEDSNNVTISLDPKQPLAWNESLISAAVAHTNAMLDRNEIGDDDFYDHTNPNVPPTDDLYNLRNRTTAAGYSSYSGVGENIDATLYFNSPDLTAETISHHERFIIDKGVPSKGHRISILNDDFQEIGINNAIGANFGYGTEYFGGNLYGALTTQNFGYIPGSNSFLTGVVYNDGAVADDDFYTVGEGLGEISIQATNTTETFSTTTYDSGGYQLRLAPDTYTVSFIGDLDSDGDSDTVTRQVIIDSQNVKIDVECFLTGTRIQTEKGEIAIENLAIGDRVRTADGKLEPIKWIGKQTIDPDRVRNPLRSHPILIKAGALGDNLPHRDLYTSPDHSIFVEGMLINAGALVNDISIVKTEPTETFVYYHIELENHTLLIAEGAPTESYLPQKEDRAEYDNCAEYEELYPQGSNLMLWPMDYPRISSRNKVPRYVRQKLMMLANVVEKKGAA